MVSSRQPGWLCVRNLAKLANNLAVDHALLVSDDTDLQTLVLGLLENLMSVQAVENLSRILTGYKHPDMNRLIGGA